MNTIFYCPIQVCRFENINPNEVEDIDDIYEDYILDEYEMRSNAVAKDTVSENIDLQDVLNFISCSPSDTDGYKELYQIYKNSNIEMIAIDDSLWLKLECGESASEEQTERIRTFFANCLNEYSAQPWLFQSNADSYMVILRPYEYYTQATCSASPSQKSSLLTESEMQEQQTENQNIGGMEL